MAGQRTACQRLACAFIFFLAIGEVSAVREKHTAEHAVKIVGNSSFSISTMWASGKQRSLQWLSANVTFREQGSMKEWPPYLEIDGLDTRYRVLPDAMVAPERINGMPTIFIAGWQAYRANKDHFGSSHYSKDEALYFRMETNPVVGETKSGWFRSAGHKIYEHKEGYRFLHYFLNSEGTQKTVDHDEVDFHAKKSYDPTMELQVPGERPRPLKRPVDDLLMLVQGVLGEISCMGITHCSCRCYYDSVKDVCQPFASFNVCEMVGSQPADKWAPFGPEQKCKSARRRRGW